MTHLAALHEGLQRVRRFRRTVRLGSAASMFVSPLLWTLLAAMLIDVTLNMGILERSVMLLIFVGVGIWGFRRFVRPVIGLRESAVATALLVERRHDIRTDLVAAIQFTDTTRPQFGSTQLRAATVDQASRLSSGLDYLQGFSRKELNRRAGLLVLSGVVFAATMLRFPGHARAFANRFLLGSSQYPSNTLIEAVEAPGDVVPFGLPVTFKVRAGGELPKTGSVKLRARLSGVTALVALRPDETQTNLYVGQLARALDAFSFQVFLGDAQTASRKVGLMPLPNVTVDFEIEPPEYARKKLAEIAARREARMALEGSTIVPVVTADKKLRSATFTANEQTLPMQREGERFVLKGSDSPMARVTATLRWQAQVVDSDGLGLERPVAGVLQVRPDQPPSIGITTATRLVWPGAEPHIRYKALDDYALDRVIARLSVQRGSQPSKESLVEKTMDVAKAANHEAEIAGTFPLDLRPFDLAKGDRVVVYFEAADYRGALTNQAARSESLVLEVSDRGGVLDALREQDENVEKQLDQIIDAQLGI